MSVIKKRTVFYDTTGGVVRFWDWAQVVTSLGTMAEPFVVNLRKIASDSLQNFDPTDEATRIDEMVGMTIDKQQQVLSGGGENHIHGGYTMPHVGR